MHDELPEGVEIPDDLSGLDAAKPAGETGRHVEEDTVAIFTPIQNGRVLAAVCALQGVHGRCIETSAGAFAVLDDTSAGATDEAGRVVSVFVKQQPILAMERRAGQITIHRWLAGVKGEKVAPGFALDEAPGVITTLMSGVQTMDEIAMTHPGKVFEARMSKFQAFREPPCRLQGRQARLPRAAGEQAQLGPEPRRLRGGLGPADALAPSRDRGATGSR
ncbi:hypothetical protein GCM10025876_34120 [Demequina litorisediminis]|uniref:Uncharacterized protein n=2 Tax=Demequina litorisediminis TaxID=1849022 RepID=A0ABQ6IH59_9MICO|nr:hypothetical protein GCM10025876_34120 [Demequina litorisediminis]